MEYQHVLIWHPVARDVHRLPTEELPIKEQRWNDDNCRLRPGRRAYPFEREVIPTPITLVNRLADDYVGICDTVPVSVELVDDLLGENLIAGKLPVRELLSDQRRDCRR